ncbi:MAG TPA: VWA domain-containing protein [Candidatus Bipolaricaulis sp.]|nr:VWA domain-containing protein [Candidatus Bipolaricaulis sp.]HRS14146.1 VWA domain-containing protein [Candidatus Bipolaricaulis sp.]HRU21781.1 VWA domain-containing protein [Candidatus Bipolaricaulis sp.]
MRKTLLFVVLCALALTAGAAPQRLAFILDASDSMNLALAGGTTKFAWAKEALTLAVNDLAAEAEFAIAVFGHRIPKRQEPATCRDIELIASFGTYGEVDRSVLTATIANLTAMGKTPLAESLRFIAARVPAPARIVLLTDGGETCGGDPIAEARRMCALGYTVDVVGLAVTPADETALRALAAAGCGQFVVARDPADLPALFRKVVSPVEPTPPAIPDCLAAYKVDPEIVALLVEHLPYPVCTDPMWNVILCFLEKNPPAKVIVGTDGDDVLFGTPENDLILGLGGNDQLFGFAGNDLLLAGPGDDLVQGGDGDDLIIGGPGSDLLFGGSGDDVVYGEDGDDRIEGEAGNDKLFGGLCNDIILGGPGCNVIDGGPGKNFVYDEGTCAPCAPTPPPCPPATPAKCLPAAPVSPVCTPTAEVKTVVEGGSIVLKAHVDDPDGDAVAITWSAPKGMFSDPHAFETTYYAPWVKSCDGEKVVVTLVAVDACGAKAQDELILHVLNVNHPPAVDAGPDLAVDEGGKVNLLASACDPDDDTLSYLWTIACGRGSLDNPRSLQPVYTAPLVSHCEGETVELTLTVTDACGAVVRDTMRVHVRNLNKAPWADAGPDLQVPEKAQIMILGKAGDPDGERLTVSWWASAGTLVNAETLCPLFIAPEVEGCDLMEVTVVLCVVDPCGELVRDSLVIRVQNVNHPPSVTADP